MKRKLLARKVDVLINIVDAILGSKSGTNKIGVQTCIDQSLKDTDLETRNPVSTPGLPMAGKDLVTEKQLPAELSGLYRRATGRLLSVGGQRPDAQQAGKELARGMNSPTNDNWARLKTLHALPGEQIEWHLEVRTVSE